MGDSTPILVVSRADLSGLLTPRQVITAVETALQFQAAGSTASPKRLHVHWAGNTLLTMPAAAPGSVGIKIVSVVPRNADRGLPVTNGIMILNDSESGLPFALMDAAELTAQRTGAVGALGVIHMTPRSTASAGIVGCGVQGAWQAIYAASVRPIREIFVFARSSTRMKSFAEIVSRHAPQVRITPCADVNTVLAKTDLIISATTSNEPVLPDDVRRLINKHLISIGSFRPSMQELPDAAYSLVDAIVVDSEFAAQEVGDVINPIRSGLVKDTQIFSIADYVTGRRQADTSRTTVYKTVGAAIYDLFVAHAFYLAARSAGVGREIAL